MNSRNVSAVSITRVWVAEPMFVLLLAGWRYLFYDLPSIYPISKEPNPAAQNRSPLPMMLQRLKHLGISSMATEYYYTMMQLVFPTDIDLYASLTLIAVSAMTSFLTAAAGIGGGIVLLAVMAALVPVAAIIPVHGAVQIGSNAGRTAIMLPHVEWRVLPPFIIGAGLGAGLGGLTAVQLPTWILQIGLGCFILWSVWWPKSSIAGRYAVIATGAFSSFLTMFFGATGTFVSAMVKTLKLGRMEHVATHSACMVAQHVIKVFMFGLLGFAFTPYLGLIIAMVISGFAGTLIGKRFLLKMNDAIFHRVLGILLTILALRLLLEGVLALSD